MKKMIGVLIAFVFVVTGCGTTGSTNGGADTSEVSAIINEHLGISPYIPETDYELGTVLLEYFPEGVRDEEPHKATISYFESLDELETLDEEMRKEFEENDPLNRKFLYGDMYLEGRIIFIEIYPEGINMQDGEVIDILGHDVQYVYYEKGDGRDFDFVIMTINFDDVGYSIEYLNRGQSDNIQEEAKALAEDIIENNS